MKYFFFYLLFLANAAFLSSAHIAFYDDYWQRKAEESRNNTLNAYVAEPSTIVNHFNSEPLLSVQFHISLCDFKVN